MQTPLALLDRVRRNGAKEIRNVMGDWKFWIPTKKGQVLHVIHAIWAGLSVSYTALNFLWMPLLPQAWLWHCRALSKEELLYSKGRPASGSTLTLLLLLMSMHSSC